MSLGAVPTATVLTAPDMCRSLPEVSMPFRFGVLGAVAPTMAQWRARAREAEALGYSALYIHDHLDPQYGPLVAAAVAAEATTTLHVGTLVLNNDLRNIVVLAREVATLGLAAEGRIEIGFGAGYAPSDYAAAGIALDSPRTRVDRLEESMSVMSALWREGAVTFEGSHVKVRNAVCEPRPTLAPRVMIGGASKRILTVAARHADTVGVNRLASSKSGGDLAPMYAADHYDRCLNIIRQAAGDRFDSLELQISAASVLLLRSGRPAGRAAAMLGFTSEEALDSPAVLIGTADDLCERLLQRRQRWGFSNIVVPAEAMVDFAPVVAQMAGK
jgi:probable F420-dependent oxidoreductase